MGAQSKFGSMQFVKNNSKLFKEEAAGGLLIN